MDSVHREPLIHSEILGAINELHQLSPVSHETSSVQPKKNIIVELFFRFIGKEESPIDRSIKQIQKRFQEAEANVVQLQKQIKSGKSDLEIAESSLHEAKGHVENLKHKLLELQNSSSPQGEPLRGRVKILDDFTKRQKSLELKIQNAISSKEQEISKALPQHLVKHYHDIIMSPLYPKGQIQDKERLISFLIERDQLHQRFDNLINHLNNSKRPWKSEKSIQAEYDEIQSQWDEFVKSQVIERSSYYDQIARDIRATSVHFNIHKGKYENYFQKSEDYRHKKIQRNLDIFTKLFPKELVLSPAAQKLLAFKMQDPAVNSIVEDLIERKETLEPKDLLHTLSQITDIFRKNPEEIVTIKEPNSEKPSAAWWITVADEVNRLENQIDKYLLKNSSEIVKEKYFVAKKIVGSKATLDQTMRFINFLNEREQLNKDIETLYAKTFDSRWKSEAHLSEELKELRDRFTSIQKEAQGNDDIDDNLYISHDMFNLEQAFLTKEHLVTQRFKKEDYLAAKAEKGVQLLTTNFSPKFVLSKALTKSLIEASRSNADHLDRLETLVSKYLGKKNIAPSQDDILEMMKLIESGPLGPKFDSFDGGTARRELINLALTSSPEAAQAKYKEVEGWLRNESGIDRLQMITFFRAAVEKEAAAAGVLKRIREGSATLNDINPQNPLTNASNSLEFLAKKTGLLDETKSRELKKIVNEELARVKTFFSQSFDAKLTSLYPSINKKALQLFEGKFSLSNDLKKALQLYTTSLDSTSNNVLVSILLDHEDEAKAQLSSKDLIVLSKELDKLRSNILSGPASSQEKERAKRLINSGELALEKPINTLLTQQLDKLSENAKSSYEGILTLLENFTITSAQKLILAEIANSPDPFGSQFADYVSQLQDEATDTWLLATGLGSSLASSFSSSYINEFLNICKTLSLRAGEILNIQIITDPMKLALGTQNVSDPATRYAKSLEAAPLQARTPTQLALAKAEYISSDYHGVWNKSKWTVQKNEDNQITGFTWSGGYARDNQTDPEEQVVNINFPRSLALEEAKHAMTFFEFWLNTSSKNRELTSAAIKNQNYALIPKEVRSFLISDVNFWTGIDNGVIDGIDKFPVIAQETEALISLAKQLNIDILNALRTSGRAL